MSRPPLIDKAGWAIIAAAVLFAAILACWVYTGAYE